MRKIMLAAPLYRGQSLWQLFAVICGCTILIIVNAGPVQAQGFFQSLFGGGSKKPASRPVSPNRRLQTDPSARYRTIKRHRYPLLRTSPSAAVQPRADERRSRQRRYRVGSGNYRTMCVRRCDGYYFPIGFNVSRSRFSKDAGICRSKCGDGANLYYMSSHATPKTMVNMRGKPYAKMKTAFLYRKKRVAGCHCRPQAWSPTETFRHKMYELNEPAERKLAREEGDIEFLAGITKIRKAVREASRAARAAEVAKRKATERAVQLAILKRLNQARALGQAEDRMRLASSIKSSRSKQVRYVQVSKQIAAHKLGQPSYFAHFAEDTGPLNVRRRRRARIYYDDGSYSYLSRNGRGRRYARRTTPPRYGRRRRAGKKATAAPSNGWGFGSKPKYRWPGD